MLSCGIVGLPNVGKTTLFNALTRASAEVSNYPFTTIGKNDAVIPVPDPRLSQLQKLTGQEEARPATFEIVDIAGLVRGAHRGEGLGNEFLGHIRNVDAVLHVVRCFPAPHVSHVEGSIDPVRDIEVVDTEMALADLASLDRRIDRVRSLMKSSRAHAEELHALEQVRAVLERGMPIRKSGLPDSVLQYIKPLSLLTAKPRIIVANVGEDAAEGLEQLKAWVDSQSETLYTIPAKLEADLTELSPEEAQAFAEELGVDASPVETLIRAAYELLGLITFYTIVGARVTAWPIPRGCTAPQAAGRVHKDMEEGFIRAEVVPYDVLVQYGSWNAAKEAGKVRIEGHDSIIQDGDVVLFRFTQPARR